eukprot:TRINITY_DN69815_c0_g1_i1.p2 TRINITY_DN69815_c0_g1~~TRINITY_DN69815_c0_g1_i1.p2  ORF type:complete len:129 (-),score=30.08 TRINITY_DN69815_c0_g1_i1:375-761(-)
MLWTAKSIEQENFRQDVLQIMSIDSWKEFSEHWSKAVGATSYSARLGSKGLEELTQLLCESEKNSLEKGYHTAESVRSALAAAAAGGFAAATEGRPATSRSVPWMLIGALAIALVAMGAGAMGLSFRS